MKIGLIVECGPDGAETHVVPHLAKLVDPGVETDVISLDTKSSLRSECGKAVSKLLDRGCHRVIVTWDLLPDWDEYEGKGCRHADKEEITQSLRNAGIHLPDRRVSLVCIERMLEAWILADHEALAAFLGTDQHPARIPKCKHPDRVHEPEAALNRYFRESRYGKYRDINHAFRIMRNADLKHLRRSDSFCRFEKKLVK